MARVASVLFDPFRALAVGSAGTIAAVIVGLLLWSANTPPASVDGSLPSDPGEASVPEPFLPDSAPVSGKDPSGDATDNGAGDVVTKAGCAAGDAAGTGCLETPTSPAAGGNPAPHFDIVEQSFVGETARDVLVALGVAQLSPGFPELKDPDGFYRMVYYKLCWSTSESAACDRIVRLDVIGHGDQVHLEPKLEIRSTECNEWRWCAWGIHVDVAFGSPARLTFTVPKAYLGVDGAALVLHRLQAETGWTSEPDALPAWHPGVTLHTSAYHLHAHGGLVTGVHIADTTPWLRVGRPLRPAPEPATAPRSLPILLGTIGANHGDESSYDRPAMDLLGFDLYEDRGDLVSVFGVRELAQQPEYDFDYSVAVGVNQKVWEIGWRHEGGRAYGYAGRCIMEMCQDGKVITPPVEVSYGSPGRIEIRTPLNFLESPALGTQTNLLWAMTMYSDANKYQGSYSEETYGEAHSVFMVDSLVGGSPYAFGSGHRADWSLISTHSAH